MTHTVPLSLPGTLAVLPQLAEPLSMNNSGMLSSLGTIGAFVGMLVGFATFVFWMIVAWRAMRAHERIASTLEDRQPR